MKKKLGILLCNIGTPDEPTKPAVRRYLKEFLSDPRIVEMSSYIWQPILRTVILPLRSKKSAELYASIWTKQGSPLLLHTQNLARELEKSFSSDNELEVYITVGMRYGNPSIQQGLLELRDRNIDHLLILPLFPQYSATTTASIFDKVAAILKKWRVIPDMRLVNNYYNDSHYINSLSDSIRHHWQSHGKKFLLFSFHGIPQRYVDLGDPYSQQCYATAQLVAAELQLTTSDWTLAFQSRLGPTKWLHPYTDKTLKQLPKKGHKDIDVICPGFAVDCLETLEEIAIRGKEQFYKAGGENFGYIEALNSSQRHVDALRQIINKEIQGWRDE